MQVVAIGASAGGIEAFRLFFERLPPDTGLGFVVVLHLAADRKSLLAEIIARWTAMSVSEAIDDECVEPNRVYVIPPGHLATLQQGRLRLRHLPPDVARDTTSIDQFFDSLAADLGPDAVGIVLSGTGHDGALGLKAIKARGGMTLAQGNDGSAPQHADMPNAAIATGAVDLIVPVQVMPRLVMAARRNPVELPKTMTTVARSIPPGSAFATLLRRGWVTTSANTRIKTFLRRVQRRMQVLGHRRSPTMSPGYNRTTTR